MARYDWETRRSFGPYSGERYAYGADYYGTSRERVPGQHRITAYGYDYGYPRSPSASPTYGRGGDRAALRWARAHGYDPEYSIEPHGQAGREYREREWRGGAREDLGRGRGRWEESRWEGADRGERGLFGRGRYLRDRGLGEEYDWNYRW